MNNRFLLLSLALHLFCVGIFYCLKKTRQILPVQNKRPPFKILLRTLKNTQTPNIESSLSKTISKKKLSLDSLKFQIQSKKFALVSAKYQKTTVQELHSSFQWADQIELGQIGHYEKFFNSIYKKIDQSLEYPEAFVENRVEGIIEIIIRVNHKGQLIGNVLSAYPKGNLLTSYCLMLVVKSLEKPLEEKFKIEKSFYHLILKFHFSINQALKPDLLPNVNNNIFTFYKVAYRNPQINRFINEFFAETMPPLIPIPGGFFLDIFRFHTYLQRLGKPTQDILREIQLEKIKKSLEAYSQ